MIKIGKQKDLWQAKALPPEVQEIVLDNVESLDFMYGINRDINSDGGYVVILTNQDDIKLLEEDLDMNLDTDVIPEYVETLSTRLGQTYTNTLILCNNDYAITIIMPLEITPNSLKEYITT